MKLRLVQAAAVLAGALAPWTASAEPFASTVIQEQAHSVRLRKGPGEALRFRWAARVDAPGHFVLDRPDGSEVWTAATVGRSAYETAPPALSGEYELRYRDAAGNERVLVHVLVACVSLDHGAPASVASRSGPLKAVGTAPLGIPSLTRLEPMAATIHPRWVSSLSPPPTPPPRRLA